MGSLSIDASPSRVYVQVRLSSSGDQGSLVRQQNSSCVPEQLPLALNQELCDDFQWKAHKCEGVSTANNRKLTQREDPLRLARTSQQVPRAGWFLHLGYFYPDCVDGSMKWVHSVSLSHHSELLTFGEFPPASSQVSNGLCLQNCPSSTDSCSGPTEYTPMKDEMWQMSILEKPSDAAAHLLHLCLWGSLTFQVQLLWYLKWTFSHTWPWNQRQVLRFQGSDVENLYYISNLTPSSSDWNHWFQLRGQ